MFRKRNPLVRRSVSPTFQKGGALGRRFNMPNRKKSFIPRSLPLSLTLTLCVCVLSHLLLGGAIPPVAHQQYGAMNPHGAILLGPTPFSALKWLRNLPWCSSCFFFTWPTKWQKVEMCVWSVCAHWPPVVGGMPLQPHTHFRKCVWY